MEQDDVMHWDGPSTLERAFEQASLDLALEGILVDRLQVPASVAYMEGEMSYAEARDAVLARYGQA